jgi:hypothetical protein
MKLALAVGIDYITLRIVRIELFWRNTHAQRGDWPHDAGPDIASLNR